MSTAITLLGMFLLAGQHEFEVASVRLSEQTVGPDYGNRISHSPTSFTANNTTLKRLVAEAWNLQPFQILGGPAWLNKSEYEVVARHQAPATAAEVQTMLRTLLTERFHLKTHRESSATKVYLLKIEKNGPKLTPSTGLHSAVFRGNLRQFASFLAVQLSIPVLEDPSNPGIASGSPIPVMDQTGLAGEYDIDVMIQPEPGSDMFTMWQRALRENLGLSLESTKTKVDFLVVDSADKVPVAN